MFKLIEWWRTRNLKKDIMSNKTNLNTIANLQLSLRRGPDGKIRFKTRIIGKFTVDEDNETVREIQELIKKMDGESKK